VVDAVNRAGALLTKNPLSVDATDLVYSFLPSKAGVGTSTIALNAAVAASQLKEPRFPGRFRSEFRDDPLHAKLQNHHSVIDAAERSVDIDENFWPSISDRDRVAGVLHAGTLNPNFRMEAAQVPEPARFCAAKLQGNLRRPFGEPRKYSIELMHELEENLPCLHAREIPSLHLGARENFHYLRTLDLGDRVSVLLNRCQKRPLISPAQVEELLGLPVHMTFSHDYQGVNNAMSEGKAVDSGSDSRTAVRGPWREACWNGR